MASRSYSILLEIDAQLVELIACLCDANLTEDQLFQAHGLVKAMLQSTARMDPSDDGYVEIHAIASRLEQILLAVRRYLVRLDTRCRTAIDRALHVLDSVVSSRLSDRSGDSNVRQCLESLDAVLSRSGKGGSKRSASKASPPGRRERRATGRTGLFRNGL